MPEIGTSGSISGDGKRSVGHRPQVTAPVLNSTAPFAAVRSISRLWCSLVRAARHHRSGADKMEDGSFPLLTN